MFPWPFPYEVYCLSCFAGGVPVLCCFLFAFVVEPLCHVCNVFLLAPHVVCLPLVMGHQLVGFSAHLLVSPADQQRCFRIRVPCHCVVFCLLVPLSAYLAHVRMCLVQSLCCHLFFDQFSHKHVIVQFWQLVCWCSMRAVCIGAAVLPPRRVHCGICREIAACAPVPTCRWSFCTTLTAVRQR